MIQRALRDIEGLNLTIPKLGGVILAQRDYDKAEKLYEESVMLARKVGDSVALGLSLGLGAFTALCQGNHRQTRLLCEEGLQTTWRLKAIRLVTEHLRVLAALAGAQGQPVRSARLWGAAAEILSEAKAMGADLTPIERYVYEPFIEAARSQLDGTAWEAAWAEGRQMTPEHAVEYALSEEESVPTTALEREEPSTGRQLAALTCREEEVAVHIACGLTNRQISEELSISERTVDAHVRNILKKLGLHARTQIVAWVTGSGRFDRN